MTSSPSSIPEATRVWWRSERSTWTRRIASLPSSKTQTWSPSWMANLGTGTTPSRVRPKIWTSTKVPGSRAGRFCGGVVGVLDLDHHVDHARRLVDLGLHPGHPTLPGAAGAAEGHADLSARAGATIPGRNIEPRQLATLQGHSDIDEIGAVDPRQTVGAADELADIDALGNHDPVKRQTHVGAFEVEPGGGEIGVRRSEFGLGLADLRLANDETRRLLTRMQLVPLLAGDHGLGLLALERDLGPGNGCLRPFEGELVVPRIDDDQDIAGAEEAAGHQRWMDLDDLSRHLRHDIDGDSGQRPRRGR